MAGVGIDTTEVLGCPSHFINPAGDLGVRLEARYRAAPTRLSVAAASTVRRLRSVERKLFAWMRESEGLYVPQSGPTVKIWAGWKDGPTPADADKVFKFLTPLRDRLGPRASSSRADFDAVCDGRVRVFFDVVEWMDALSRCDASIGTRFHGNMLALQSAVPAVCIVHDGRTEELCGTIGLPKIPLSRFGSLDRPGEVLDSVDFDGAAFDDNRRRLAGGYAELLTRHAIVPSSLLAGLAEP